MKGKRKQSRNWTVEMAMVMRLRGYTAMKRTGLRGVRYSRGAG